MCRDFEEYKIINQLYKKNKKHLQTEGFKNFTFFLFSVPYELPLCRNKGCFYGANIIVEMLLQGECSDGANVIVKMLLQRGCSDGANVIVRMLLQRGCSYGAKAMIII